MNSTFYLPRKLTNDDKIYTEAELLAASNYVVILAEPGGGKSRLMESLARQLNVEVTTANKLTYSGVAANKAPLVIDAFDELAKIDGSEIYQLLGKAEASAPTHVFLASRSSEWSSSNTQAFKEFIGHPPLVARLCEFEEKEQRAIFKHHVKGEDFKAFRNEVARFDLEILLPNPQFLTLFADAYVESGRHFTNKQAIFAQAIERLAKETNTHVRTTEAALSNNQKVELASEVFAKLLLSGAEGVCTSEATENRMYPLLAALFGKSTMANAILATRLFKPANTADQHQPVHKIVIEYCAANYLNKRIANSTDFLTLDQCLPIIAPNNTVRDELRGLLGWMATLGNKAVQEKIIELDPYAVLANGDPSQLEPSSKHLLIEQLKDIETKDPNFRRGDFWRRFSVAGFFTQDVVENIKPILTSGDNGHLRNLILELLEGATENKNLKNELRQLALTPEEDKHTRFLASRNLRSIDAYDHHADLSVLIFEATHTSLSMVADYIEELGPETFEPRYLAGFFRVCANLYANHLEDNTIGQRYFVKRLISKLDLLTIEWLLDELTGYLTCVCNKENYECDCRNGISKIIGSMLDRYFELADPPYEPLQIWCWVKNLNFNEVKTAKQSMAVQVLQSDDDLRHGIIAHVFEGLTDRDQINDVEFNLFRGHSHSHSHSGLCLHTGDYEFIVDLAFETDNPNLWASFIARHQYHRNKEERGPDSLRRHMREQAMMKPLFMQEWTKSNRAAAEFERQNKRHFKRNQREMRIIKRRDKTRLANIKYIQDNRELIEKGFDRRILQDFGIITLNDPSRIKDKFGDESLVKSALRNSLDYIAPDVPDLPKLAELHCASQHLHLEYVLFAGCLEVLRTQGNLESVDLRLLKALRTGIYTGYGAVSQEDRYALKAEVDRLIFPDKASAEDYLRQYLEPQLANLKCQHPEVDMLHGEEVFEPLRAELPIEWLKRFHEMAFHPLDRLFEIAAQYGNRGELNEIIKERCIEFTTKWPNPTDDKFIEPIRTFWLLRSWYFLKEAPQEYWNWLKADKTTVLSLYELSGQINRSDRPKWPNLTSKKVEAILDAFIDQWPMVNLPSHYGSEDPEEQKAYRFLTEVIWHIDSDDPDEAVPVLNRLLADTRFSDLHKNLKSIYSAQLRKKALRDFEPPTPQDVVDLLEHSAVVTVEGLRQRVIQELQEFQGAINGGEFNSANRFYSANNQHLDEVPSTEIIAERLKLRLEPQNITVTLEHQQKRAKRSDFTVAKMIAGKRRLLVTEVKGQWHEKLFTAASAQLSELYAINPDAEQQGIFIVIWFGAHEKVAGRVKHGIQSAKQLQQKIESKLPPELKGLIDVFVLDVSRP